VVSDHFVTKIDTLRNDKLLDAKDKKELCKKFPKEKSWRNKSIYVATGLQGGVAYVDNKEKSFVDPMSRNGVFALAPYLEIGQQVLHRGSRSWPRSQLKYFGRVGIDYADSSQTALRKTFLVGTKTSLTFPEGKSPIEFYGHINMFAGFGVSTLVYSLLTGPGGNVGGRLAVIGAGIAGSFVGDTLLKKYLGNEFTIGAVHQTDKGVLGFFEMSLFTIGLGYLSKFRLELQSSARAIFKEKRRLDPMTGELETKYAAGVEWPLRLVAEWIY